MSKLFLILFVSTLAYSKQFSVSGVSSGAAMAVQLHVAHSADCTGAGIIAGPPYYCAKNSLVIASTACATTPYLLDISPLIRYTQEQSREGTIDDYNNLKANTKGIWIFSGLLDTVVNQHIVKQLQKFYESFIPSYKITSVYNVAAQHSWVTNSYGGLCVYLGWPFINNCNLDAAGHILYQIYGNIKPAVTPLVENLRQFDQTIYVDITQAVMENTGFIYIPSGCQNINNECLVHVAIHGCLQNYNSVGDRFVSNNGLNGYAEANNIIVIYPQVAVDIIANPQGCWDWWGYTGSDYALKSGLQVSAIYKMTQSIPLLSDYQMLFI
ncbi:unnamed protein product [Blepharisma stoltei]|uniref:Poly(3-hydroxybutyrate) depolymerase n=1 Tax=Blepharisma stoltei TaxID=1481888 RepID=A0AAU9J4N7_9CILI|nr:unnamed protein product [Blepharisma stoltei]